MDAATLGSRFTILTISVLIRGYALQMAWTIAPATAKGAWRPHWDARFDQRRDMTPAARTVIVLADRGLDARRLLRAIAAPGWRPFVRIHRQGRYRRADTIEHRPLSAVLRPGGAPWRGRGPVARPASASWTARCWRAGTRAMPTPG